MLHSVTGTPVERSQANTTESASINQADRFGSLLIAVPWSLEL
jgi:hypothetical protein